MTQIETLEYFMNLAKVYESENAETTCWEQLEVILRGLKTEALLQQWPTPISFLDRKPTKSDADSNGRIACYDTDGDWMQYPWDNDPDGCWIGWAHTKLWFADQFTNKFNLKP
jgi:hypothetical protein